MIDVCSPLTGNKNVIKLHSFDTQKIIDDWLKSFDMEIKDEFSGCSRIDLYQCLETGLRFFVPMSVAGSNSLYVKLQKFEWFYLPWKWEHEALFSRLNLGEKILEVGCATGVFVERLSHLGFSVEGIEFNKSAVAVCEEMGLPVSMQNMKQLAINRAEAFDVVCSFQVLEHVADPLSFINESLALLKCGGRLVICVPDNDSFLHYKQTLLDMPPHHVTQWNLKAFQSLERLFSLKLVCVKYEPLPKTQVTGYLYAHRKRMMEKSLFFKVLMNKYTMPIFRFFLNSGLRHMCRGQSIYVEYEKLE
ncbi:MAG: methyltransferase domain-containing protein [Gammaproteobacteria bacterium]|nr:methyltransferase domain-containing protein [Gammaproteobacteria bacterium]